MVKKTLLLALLLAMAGTSFAEENWISLFNGKDLDGWIPKVKGSVVGENPGDIFRVEDGLLTISYDAFDTFGGRFGHLFVDRPLTNYRFRCEYRFIGEQVKGGPGWAFRNNGVMTCCQEPESMGLGQNFPHCIEIQLLGAYDDGKPRTTGNLLPLKNNIDVDGKTGNKPTESKAASLPLGQWVKSETIVDKGTIQQFINGELVVEGSNPRSKIDGSPMNSGYIAIQAESHPTQFRNIEILELD
jgi:hypothetical protein